MENYPVGVNTIGQLYANCMSDRKSRFWQIDTHPNSSSEVICPKPCRSIRVPYFINTFNRTGPKAKSTLPMYKVDCSPEILDHIWSQDNHGNDPDLSNQVGFLCGSPPARTNNPVVHDAEFFKQAQSLPSPLGSPTCRSSFGGSPKMRIEGFACGSSENSCVGFSVA
ncbi:hypothetical protein Cni_G11254 [Canna indica]|uniref:Uncharacterized protein n=1 Tax=Canna indica TaxID=4628 RepID=A0AAQ3QBJ0_9LILI|nr:hypothetical protein Cni_G11254 [Canna indica]